MHTLQKTMLIPFANDSGRGPGMLSRADLERRLFRNRQRYHANRQRNTFNIAMVSMSVVSVAQARLPMPEHG